MDEPYSSSSSTSGDLLDPIVALGTIKPSILIDEPGSPAIRSSSISPPPGITLINASQPLSASSTSAPIISTTGGDSASVAPSIATRGKRRFECDYSNCDKTFSTSGHLARHVRVHTGEKAFQCTYPGCESRFSRHDNMLQHYRNHIVRNARRKKKAFANAIAGGSSIGGELKDANGSGGVNGVNPGLFAQSSGPVFVHSSYSSLGPPSAGGSGTSSSRGRGAQQPRRAMMANSVSPVMSEQTLGSSLKPSSLHLGSLHPRQGEYLSGPLTHPIHPQMHAQHLAATTSTTYLSPPLASPSVMDRPHTASTSFFPNLSMHSAPMMPHLTHRHSYSAIQSQPVLEPITPTSELPSYPYPYAYPPSPRDSSQYSPALSTSSSMMDQQLHYFHPMTAPASTSASLYPDRYGPPGSSYNLPLSSPSHQQQQQQMHSSASHSSYLVQQQHRVAMHASLGSHNPLLSGILEDPPSVSSRPPSRPPSSTASASDPTSILGLSASVPTGADIMDDGHIQYAVPTARWLRQPVEHGWQPDMGGSGGSGGLGGGGSVPEMIDYSNINGQGSYITTQQMMEDDQSQTQPQYPTYLDQSWSSYTPGS